MNKYQNSYYEDSNELIENIIQTNDSIWLINTLFDLFDFDIQTNVRNGKKKGYLISRTKMFSNCEKDETVTNVYIKLNSIWKSPSLIASYICIKS
jgi:hypothetical protein